MYVTEIFRFLLHLFPENSFKATMTKFDFTTLMLEKSKHKMQEKSRKFFYNGVKRIIISGTKKEMPAKSTSDEVYELIWFT